MASPISTISTVSRESRKAVFRWLLMTLPPTLDFPSGVTKKTFTPGVDAWIKVLLAGLPRSRAVKPY